MYILFQTLLAFIKCALIYFSSSNYLILKANFYFPSKTSVAETFLVILPALNLSCITSQNGRIHF